MARGDEGNCLPDVSIIVVDRPVSHLGLSAIRLRCIIRSSLDFFFFVILLHHLLLLLLLSFALTFAVVIAFFVQRQRSSVIFFFLLLLILIGLTTFCVVVVVAVCVFLFFPFHFLSFAPIRSICVGNENGKSFPPFAAAAAAAHLP